METVACNDQGLTFDSQARLLTRYLVDTTQPDPDRHIKRERQKKDRERYQRQRKKKK